MLTLPFIPFVDSLPPPLPHPTVRLLMSSSFWAVACTSAQGKPVQELLNSARASCGVTVRWAAVDHAHAQLILSNAQIAVFCVSAVCGGVMFLRWRRMRAEDRRLVWRFYGWYSGLMSVGSVFGTVTWAAWMQNLVANYSRSTPEALLSKAHDATLRQQAQYWIAAYLVTYASRNSAQHAPPKN